ncbi:Protodermal factor 1 [Bienertia sinuspersici]
MSKETVNCCSSLSQLGMLLFLIIMLGCFASSSMAARPAFLFTRHRGHCTPQYWGSRREEWPKMVPQRSTVSKVFGSRATERFRSDMTLLEAATRNDDVGNAYASLLKQSSAALLNSYARVGYPYKAWEIKILLLQGLISQKDAAQQAQILKKANEACS